MDTNVENLIGRKVKHTFSWKSWYEVIPDVQQTIYEIVAVDYWPNGDHKLCLRDEKGNEKWIRPDEIGKPANHWIVGLQETYTIQNPSGGFVGAILAVVAVFATIFVMQVI